MKPTPMTIDDEQVTVHCTHAETWPPAHARLDESFDAQRERGFIDENKYQRLLVWERTCGLMKMGEKCLTCPLALVEVDGAKVPLVKGEATTGKPFFARAKPNVRRQ